MEKFKNILKRRYFRNRDNRKVYCEREELIVSKKRMVFGDG